MKRESRRLKNATIFSIEINNNDDNNNNVLKSILLFRWDRGLGVNLRISEWIIKNEIEKEKTVLKLPRKEENEITDKNGYIWIKGWRMKVNERSEE